MMRLGVLGSTRGTHLQSLLAAIDAQTLAAEVAVVISNRADALILDRASTHDVPAQFLDPQGLTREAYDQQVSNMLRAHHVDCVVLIGYMRILSAPFVAQWRGRIINVHPSLLPAFAGMMDLAVHRAVIAAGVKETGCTVHQVTEEVDAGPIVIQQRCVVQPDDTPETLKARVQALEGNALVAAIVQLALEHNTRQAS